MADPEFERTEIEAALEARRELGLRYDAELVDGFHRVCQRRPRSPRSSATLTMPGPRPMPMP